MIHNLTNNIAHSIFLTPTVSASAASLYFSTYVSRSSWHRSNHLSLTDLISSMSVILVVELKLLLFYILHYRHYYSLIKLQLKQRVIEAYLKRILRILLYVHTLLSSSQTRHKKSRLIRKFFVNEKYCILIVRYMWH